ncbi:MAG: tRNA preQ1(34) S-adenosylmethionine ribosyltransferase-isomerase QueA [Caulobacteraceae bacterium]|nr:tRNA preQ1(34) S-adenosylmethionine ribosyltransferase-isomerase QueA [Caulobacteraceae bacterium]
MQLSDFDFDLPQSLIALRPAEPRDAARLLVVDGEGRLEDRRFSDLPDLLRPGDALVLNDTRVIAARLFGWRERDGSSAAISATLHRRLSTCAWKAFVRPAKRLRPGDIVIFGAEDEGLRATVSAHGEAGEVTLAFDRSGAVLDEAIARHGAMPLPPYIASKRPEDELDRRDYQTVFARDPGSVAAPTAGLHFTPELLARVAGQGVGLHFITLEVGAGTFLPVKTENLAEHRMHAERAILTKETAAALQDVRARGGRIVCVGTTSLRLLETAASTGRILPFDGETDIFITPGYAFRAADGLITNFHLPRSTLFMLVSAFSGLEVMRRAYAHAIGSEYRFYSYGDASLLWRAH